MLGQRSQAGGEGGWREGRGKSVEASQGEARGDRPGGGARLHQRDQGRQRVHRAGKTPAKQEDVIAAMRGAAEAGKRVMNQADTTLSTARSGRARLGFQGEAQGRLARSRELKGAP